VNCAIGGWLLSDRDVDTDSASVDPASLSHPRHQSRTARRQPNSRHHLHEGALRHARDHAGAAGRAGWMDHRPPWPQCIWPTE